ncbi:HelD family protein [Cryptosporangium aurantiacum]|uniref:DNA helicase IV n=1 Tax=Cryptosporangium aurantiacum TaxID=134849 RepID=A0A1M7RH44_9ACTN|nr:AAA family ATPase [Cryptosporangium aurantiacum]SHN45574.1 DNA helicase IV [Cryptosporangium aurantiacum]
MTTLDAELADEAVHLETSRTALAAMRERTEALTRSDATGDPFSSEMLARALARRMEQLLDDGTTPLFFGRLDFGPTGSPYAGETFHVGRRHVTDAAGDPLVVDWRAPVSTAFYQASALAPQGVRRRRRFGFAGGRLTSFEDEHLTSGEESGLGSRLLTEEIERPRVGPMRDIVATIQPDQDVLVRADLETSLCIQGAPGTGKTAVGLHRAAYLLYAYRERLSRTGVLVVGPNAAFLRYIAEVLPALGEVNVLQRTVAELVGRVPIKAVDTPEALAVKGDARMAAVLASSLTSALRAPSEPLVYPETGARLRLGPTELGEITTEARTAYTAGTPYSTARDRVAHRVAERFRRQVERRGGSPTDAWVSRVARSRTMRTWLDAVWPPADPAALVARLFSDQDLLARAADGILSPAEQDAIARPPGRPRWTEADAVLIDEAAALLERTPGFGHVIVDEAQDLTPMQARAIARRSPHGSLTVLGDLAQGTAVGGARDWATLLEHLAKPATVVTPLTTGYRMPSEIVEFANRLLPALAAGVGPARSVRHAPGALDVQAVRDPIAAAVAAARAAVAEPGSVAVICADAMVARIFRKLTAAGLTAVRADQPSDEPSEPPITVLPATLAKGLEFDTVVVVEPAAIVAAEPRGLNRLYVVLTRAVSRLIVLHTENLPHSLVPVDTMGDAQ